MLQPLRANPRRQQVAGVERLPAPVGGLNGKDALSDMPPEDAVVLDNIFPEANYCTLRRGHASHATGMVGDVQTVITHHTLNGSEKMFGAANGAIWDATAAGAASSVYSTSITSNKWQTINFSTTSQLHTLAFNGVDTPLKYDGSSWGTNSITGSGLTSTKLISAFSHKERVWLIEKDSLNLWYLASQAIGGAAVKLPLTGVFTMGGSLVAGGALSVSDTGDGMDDLLIALTDNGEIAIYSGTNPATDFALIGVYRCGEPLGQRPLLKLGGDLIVLTTDGAVSVRQSINFDRARMDLVAITAKINDLFNGAARSYKANFGWQGIVYPKSRYAIFNVPEIAGTRQRQYVQNTITGAWCRFTDLNANCWGLLNDELYFGGAGKIFKADTGFNDNGAQINADLKTAFNHCKSPGVTKLFTNLRPYLVCSGIPQILVGVNVDYADLAPVGTLSSSASTSGLWGSGLWDAAMWGGTGLQVKDWQATGAVGSCAAARIRIASSGKSVRINGFDLMYQRGNVL